MADIRITDLVDSQVFTDLEKLSDDIKNLKQQFVEAARELAQGLNMKISTSGDLEKFNQLVAESSRKAQQATEQLNTTIDRQREIIGQTTNTISRELAEIEKENKAKRAAFEQYKSAIDLAERLIGSRQNNIIALARMQGELKQVTEAQKALDTAVKNGTISEQDAVSKRVRLIEQQRDLKAGIKDLNLVLTNQEKQMQASDGSYQKLSLQLEFLKKAYKGLSEEEKNSDIGKTLGAEIGNLDAHLKDLAADMGEFQRNTGNYAIANQSVKTELRELVQEIAMLTLQYRNMSDEEKASAQGQELEQKLSSMTERASELKDAVDDVNRSIKSGASDTGTFSAFSEGINMLISGVGGLTAASHLLGIGEKDLIKIQTTLQASLAASNALTKAQSALQKESALMTGVSTLQQKAHAAAIRMKTVAEGEGIVVTKAATVAQRVFNAVARANPYVLLATGIGLAAAAIVGIIKGTKSETEEHKKAREEMEKRREEYEKMMDVESRMQEAREKGIESTSSEIANLHILYAAATDATRSLEERRKAVEKLQETYPDYLGNLEEETIMAGKAKDAFDDLTTSIYNKAIAQAAQESVKEYFKAYFESLEEIRKKKEELTKSTAEYNEEMEKARQKIYEETKGFGLEEQKKVLDLYVKWDDKLNDSKERINELKNGLLELVKQSKDYKRVAEEVAKEVSTDDLLKSIVGSSSSSSSKSTTTKKEKEVVTKTYEEIKEEVLEITQEILAEKISMTEKGSKDEYNLTMQYIYAEQELREIEIIKGYNKEKKALDEALANKTISQEEYNVSMQKLEDARTEQTVNADRKANKAREKAQKDYTEAYITSIEKAYSEEQEQRTLNLTREVTALTKKRAEKIITEEEYQKQLADMQMKYAQESAEKQIEMLEKVLESEELTADQRAEITKELAKVKTKAAKDAADAELKNVKNVEKEEEKAAKKREKEIKSYLKSVSDMVGKVNKLVSAIYDGQIQKIEEEQEEAEKAHDAEIERIETLEETGAISKEEAEARKRAAEQRSAEKQEELEKKKQELKYKQAVWEKVTSIAQAGIATALAITEALPNFVLAALVGAMGAVEVATIIATPIASYAKGTKDKEGHPGGLALVGDAGKKEAVLLDNKLWITPDKPTIVDMPKGAVVYPDADNLPEPIFMTVTPTGEKDSPIVIVHHDSKKLERGVAQTNALIKQSIIMQKRLAYNAAYENYKARRL